MVIVDADYDMARLAFLLADLPVELLGRLRMTGCCAFRAAAAGAVVPVG
jgi:hypothetical protein